MSYNISQMIFFIKDQTSQHVSVERPIQVTFIKGISAGKAALQHFFFSFLLLFLPLPHFQKLISLSFSRQLVLLVSVQDIAVRWSSLALPVWYLPNWLLSAFPLWDCIRHGIFAFPMKVPFLSMCATSHYLWRLILPPAMERWKPLNPREAHLCFSLNSS